MTKPERNHDDSILLAMERACRSLCGGSDAGTVFLEERSDLRLVLGSDDQRDLTVTRSKGAAAGQRDSIHICDPSLEELLAFVRGESVRTAAVLGKPACASSSSPELDLGWMFSAESSLRTQAQQAVRGIPDGRWSATIIAFSQNIWVLDGDGDVHRDSRQGCRVELKARVGRHPNGFAMDDCVIGWGNRAIPETVVPRVFERADLKGGGLSSQLPGNLCAVLAPGVGGVVIHELVGHALEGDVSAGRKTWMQQDTLPLPPRDLRVIDDPRLGRGAWRIDDEGVPAGETELVSDGRPVGLLLDRDTAVLLGKTSTGHGRRSSYLTPVRPRMGCTFIAPGQDEPHDVMTETGTGVFIRRLTAGHTDPIAGRASFVVSEADAIVAGGLGSPLEPFVIELDGPDAWRSIDRVGHDLAFDTCVGSCVRDGQPLAVSVGAPTIRIGVMRVVS